MPGVCLTNDRLLRPTRSGGPCLQTTWGDRFPYIVPHYARETIAQIRSLGVALATAIIGQTDSWHQRVSLARCDRTRAVRPV